MTFKGTIIIKREEDWFVATCLENNIASQGKTIDEATENLKEAIELFYEDETVNIWGTLFYVQLATSGGATRPSDSAEQHLLALVRAFAIPPACGKLLPRCTQAVDSVSGNFGGL